jgi:hypothetical protein
MRFRRRLIRRQKPRFGGRRQLFEELQAAAIANEMSPRTTDVGRRAWRLDGRCRARRCVLLLEESQLQLELTKAVARVSFTTDWIYDDTS